MSYLNIFFMNIIKPTKALLFPFVCNIDIVEAMELIGRIFNVHII